MHRASAVCYCALWPVRLYLFSTLSHKWHDFQCGGASIEYKIVFWFSLQLLPETFLILRRTMRDININVQKISVKHSLLLSVFNETFSSDFRKKNTQISNCIKSFQSELRCFMRMDRRTEWQTHMTKLIVAFRNFADASKYIKIILVHDCW